MNNQEWQWAFNDVIKCRITNVPVDDKVYWYADIRLTTPMATQDDIYILRSEFPFSKNMIVTQTDSKIIHIETLDLLLSICHHFSIAVLEMISCINSWMDSPFYWTDRQVSSWGESVSRRLDSEGA